MKSSGVKSKHFLKGFSLCLVLPSIFHVSLLLSCARVLGGLDYCSVTKEHVFCKDGFKDFGGSCGVKEFIGYSRPSGEDRNEILKAHNVARNKIATGQERLTKTTTLPLSANMKQMYWDNELEAAALSTARKCLLKYSCVPCLKLARFQARELIYRREATDESYLNVTWTYIINKMHLEDLREFDEYYVNNYQALGKPSGFTSFADGSVNLVGCGRITYKSEDKFTLLAVCTHGPVNENATILYAMGEPCSKCPKLTICSSLYSGLCADLLTEKFRRRQEKLNFTMKQTNLSKEVLQDIIGNTSENIATEATQMYPDIFSDEELMKFEALWNNISPDIGPTSWVFVVQFILLCIVNLNY